MASEAATDRDIYFSGERVAIRLRLKNPKNSSIEVEAPFAELNRNAMLFKQESVNQSARWTPLAPDEPGITETLSDPNDEAHVRCATIWLQPGQFVEQTLDVQASCEQLGSACNIPLRSGKYRIVYNFSRSPYKFAYDFAIIDPIVKRLDYLLLDEQSMAVEESGTRRFSDRYLMFGCLSFDGTDYIIMSLKAGYFGPRPNFEAGQTFDAKLASMYLPYFRVAKGVGSIRGLEASTTRDEKVTLRWRDDRGEHTEVLEPPYQTLDALFR